MNKNLLYEELNRMKYLSNHERGVVISENKRDETDWKKGTSGKINLQSSPINGISRLAYNIGYEGGSYYMSNSSKLPNLYEEETKSETYTLKGFDFKNTSFPYPDNMIGPKFDDYPAEKSIYDNFIDELSRFINNGGLNNITSIKIQGTADAAAPNTNIPRKPSREGQEGPPPKYDNLDHDLVGDTTPYGGDTNPETMNLYLANNRAKVLGQMIIGAISGTTGQDITSKIVYEEGINYYGQKDKRGQEFRGVSVKPDYKSFTKRIPDSQASSKETSNRYIDLTYYGGEGKLPATQLNNDTIGVKITDIPESLKNMPMYARGILNGSSVLDGEIKGSELFVGGISYGNFVEVRPEDMGELSDRSEKLTKYITEGRIVKTGGDKDYVHVKILKFSLRTYS
jgi:hypothetical protein